MTSNISSIELQQSEEKKTFEIYPLEWINQNKNAEPKVYINNDNFKLIWIKSLAGKINIDMLKYNIENESIFCINPGQLTQFIADECVTGNIISFSPTFLGLENFGLLQKLQLYYTSSSMMVLSLDKEIKHKVNNLMENMMNEYNNSPKGRNEVISGFLKILLIYLSSQKNIGDVHKMQSRNIAIVHKFIFLLDSHFIEKKLVVDYAEKLHVTPNYLNAVLKKITGVTASHHIQQRIVLQAKRQAVHSDLSMKEIAYNLGFEDLSHFSKFFKKSSGQNFTSFKKNTTVHFA